MKQRPALGQWLEGASNNRGRRCASFDCDAIRAAAHLGGGEDLAWSEVDPARWESVKVMLLKLCDGRLLSEKNIPEKFGQATRRSVVSPTGTIKPRSTFSAFLLIYWWRQHEAATCAWSMARRCVK